MKKPQRRRLAAVLALSAAMLFGGMLAGATSASAAPATPTPAPIQPIAPIPPIATAAPTASPNGPIAPTQPTAPATPESGQGTVHVDLNGVNGKPSNSIVIILGLTVLAVAPALLILCTSFTKIIVVLSLARNALGTQSVPPNQVLAGLALFISLFIMGPTLSAINSQGVQPYLNGEKTQSQAYDDGVKPLKEFMLKQTRKQDLAMFVNVSKQERPATKDDVSMTTLVPAFVLSELRAAFIIGFVVFIPFLLIDLIVSSSLMSMGMMMLPPTMISLPFKLLLFVMVDGWGLIVHSLVSSYH